MAVFAAQWILALSFGRGQICGLGDLVCGLGAKVNEAIIAGQVWRFVTPIFVHVTPVHILINMYSLYALGPAVERFFGTRRFFITYMLSGIAGVILSLSFSPYVSAGASGAIFGLLGAFAAFLYTHRSTFGSAGTIQLRQIIFVALLNLSLGLSPGIDNWGHLGGLVFGVAQAWFFGPRFEVTKDEETSKIHLVDKRPWSNVWPVALFAATIIAALAFVVLLNPIQDLP